MAQRGEILVKVEAYFCNISFILAVSELGQMTNNTHSLTNDTHRLFLILEFSNIALQLSNKILK